MFISTGFNHNIVSIMTKPKPLAAQYEVRKETSI